MGARQLSSETELTVLRHVPLRPFMKISPQGTFNSSRHKDPQKLKAEVDRRIAAGIGQGSMDAYEPWLKIGSFPSSGASYATPSLKCARTHHFLAKGEFNFYLLQEFADDVVEIREQFPLINYGRTFQIARELGFKPSFYRDSTVPRVYTTDFMLTKVNAVGETYLSAVSLKSRTKLNEIAKTKRGLKRSMELAIIEKSYWGEMGVQWDTVFSEDLPMIRVRNIRALMTHANIKPSLCSEKAINRMVGFLLDIGLSAASEMTLDSLLRTASRYIYMSRADVFELFMYMVWHKHIVVDINDDLIRKKNPLGICSVKGVGFSSEILGVA